MLNTVYLTEKAPDYGESEAFSLFNCRKLR